MVTMELIRSKAVSQTFFLLQERMRISWPLLSKPQTFTDAQSALKGLEISTPGLEENIRIQISLQILLDATLDL